ncbi:ankyrin repeat domain-containing protein, partial [Ottowia flava]
PAAAAPAQRLLRAVQSGDLAAMRAALADGAPVDSADSQGRTALMWAARRGDTAAVRALLDAGANPKQTDLHGHTAVDQALGEGHEALARLIERHSGGGRGPAGESPVR